MDQYPTVLASVQTERRKMGSAQETHSLNIKCETATIGTEGTKKPQCHMQRKAARNPDQHLLAATRAASELSGSKQVC